MPVEFTYTVCAMDRKGHYEVTKWGDDPEPLEQYDVTVPQVSTADKVFCNCMGFRRQNYDKKDHKHIRLVIEFIKHLEPAGRVYRLDGPSHNVSVIVVKESLFTNEPLTFDPSD